MATEPLRIEDLETITGLVIIRMQRFREHMLFFRLVHTRYQTTIDLQDLAYAV